MRAGRLRHRIAIQANTPTRDSHGQEIESWATVATVWGAVEPQRGGERFIDEANQLLAERTTQIVIRYWSGLTIEHRISWNGRVFNIQGIINPDYRNREMRLTCEEIAFDE